MRDPERPYAQLLTPVAKSQKLLLRLRHQKLLPTPELVHSQAVFTLWQKLLAKNIASTPWPYFADILLFFEDQYIALKLWPFGDLITLERAYQERYLAGYLLVDAREVAPNLAIEGQKLVVAASLADRLGSQLWQWLGDVLSPWQSKMVTSLPALNADAALDMIGLLRQYNQAPWPDGTANAPAFAELAHAFFIVWRARGNTVAWRRLAGLGVSEAAIAWLSENSGVVELTGKGYAMRS